MKVSTASKTSSASKVGILGEEKIRCFREREGKASKTGFYGLAAICVRFVS